MKRIEDIFRLAAPPYEFIGFVDEAKRKHPVGEPFTSEEIIEFLDTKTELKITPTILPFIEAMHKSYFTQLSTCVGFPMIAVEFKYNNAGDKGTGILELHSLFASDSWDKHPWMTPKIGYLLTKKGASAGPIRVTQAPSSRFTFNNDDEKTKKRLKELSIHVPRTLYTLAALLREAEWLREVSPPLFVRDHYAYKSLDDLSRFDSSAGLKVFTNPYHQFMLCNIGSQMHRQELQGAAEEKIAEICSNCQYYGRFLSDGRLTECPVRNILKTIQEKLNDGTLFPHGKIAVEKTMSEITDQTATEAAQRMLKITSQNIKKLLHSPEVGEVEALSDFTTLLSYINHKTGVYY